MTTITIPGAIYSQPGNNYADPAQCVNGRQLKWFGGDAVDSFGDFHLVMPHALTFDLPDDWNPAIAEVAMLREKKAKAAAAFYAMVTDIDRQINELLALDNEVTA